MTTITHADGRVEKITFSLRPFQNYRTNDGVEVGRYYSSPTAVRMEVNERRYIYVGECPMLESITLLSEVEDLRIRNCNALKNVGTITATRSVHIKHCPLLEHILVYHADDIRVEMCADLRDVNCPENKILACLFLTDCPKIKNVRVLADELFIRDCAELDVVRARAVKRIDLRGCPMLVDVRELPPSDIPPIQPLRDGAGIPDSNIAYLRVHNNPKLLRVEGAFIANLQRHKIAVEGSPNIYFLGARDDFDFVNVNRSYNTLYLKAGIPIELIRDLQGLFDQ